MNSIEEKQKIKSLIKESLGDFSIILKEKNKERGILLFIDGWGTSGKASLINDLIDVIDPKFYNVEVLKDRTAEERRKPFITRYMEKIPEYGNISLFDNGYLNEIVHEYMKSRNKDLLDKRINEVKLMLKHLMAENYQIIPVFLNISEDEQKKRIQKLSKKENSYWRVSEADRYENKHYKEFNKYFNYCIKSISDVIDTLVIDNNNKLEARLDAIKNITESINNYNNTDLLNLGYNIELTEKILENSVNIKESDVTKLLDKDTYKARLRLLQDQLKFLHNEIYRLKIPVIIVYEGWDASGKGGSIKRLTKPLDPRGFKINPIASPAPYEKNRHFLWRFWTRLPKNGHISIFDRSWYGRVMVEKIEGFCSKKDYLVAYDEINEFEEYLVNEGCIIIKFWMNINKGTQAVRFKLREVTPSKQWKITDEDWRNREKWDQYEDALGEMIQLTSTDKSKWNIIDADDKRYARIKTLEIVVEELIKAIERKNKKEKSDV